MKVADLEKSKSDFFNNLEQYLRENEYIDKKFEWMIGSKCNIPTKKVNDKIFYKYTPIDSKANQMYIEQEKKKKSFLELKYELISFEKFKSLKKKVQNDVFRVYESKPDDKNYTRQLKRITDCSENQKGKEEFYINETPSNK